MKIPNQLNIGGQKYDVIITDRFKKDGQSSIGSCQPIHNKVWIEKDIPKTQQESTFLHEIIEVINSNNDLGMTHQQISTLETQLYQVLKENQLLKK